MAVIATVTVRPFARRVAAMVPARSICDSSQPPKMSPCGLASAGIAIARSAGSHWGGRSELVPAGMGDLNRLMCSLIRVALAAGIFQRMRHDNGAAKGGEQLFTHLRRPGTQVAGRNSCFPLLTEVYTSTYIRERGGAMAIARVFRSGNSQAVRLPKEFQVKSKEVEIFRRGDEIVL